MRDRYPVAITVKELGQITRNYRKSRKGYTLQAVSHHANIGTRFISELERGKETCEIGKAMKVMDTAGLDVLLVPRSLRRTEAYQQLHEIMMMIKAGEDIKDLVPKLYLG